MKNLLTLLLLTLMLGFADPSSAIDTSTKFPVIDGTTVIDLRVIFPNETTAIDQFDYLPCSYIRKGFKLIGPMGREYFCTLIPEPTLSANYWEWKPVKELQ
jgi:hypothetical protein